MSDTNNGGQAFPAGLSSGMSLRDWFAGMALDGLLSDPRRIEIEHGDSAAGEICEWAYKFADLMLEAREKRA